MLLLPAVASVASRNARTLSYAAIAEQTWLCLPRPNAKLAKTFSNSGIRVVRPCRLYLSLQSPMDVSLVIIAPGIRMPGGTLPAATRADLVVLL